MSSRPLRLRPAERSDLRRVTAHYAVEAGAPVALAFVVAVEAAFAHLPAQPTSGSLRYARLAGLPGLRAWPVRRFPYLLFYFDRADHLDVARLLHMRRDIPALLR